MKVLIKSYLDKPPLSGGGQVYERDISMNRCTIAKVLEDLGVDGDEVGLFFVNEERVNKDYSLKEGDTLVLVPLLGGG